MMLAVLIVHAVAAGDGIAHEFHQVGLGGRRADVPRVRLDGPDGTGGHGCLGQLDDAHDMAFHPVRPKHGAALFCRVDHGIHDPLTVQFDRQAHMIAGSCRVGSMVVPGDDHLAPAAGEGELRARTGEGQPEGILQLQGAAQGLDVLPGGKEAIHRFSLHSRSIVFAESAPSYHIFAAMATVLHNSSGRGIIG